MKKGFALISPSPGEPLLPQRVRDRRAIVTPAEGSNMPRLSVRTASLRFAARRLAAPFAAALLLGACSVIPGGDRDRDYGPPPPEFVGRQMTVVAANGGVTTLRFERDGDVTARFGERETAGRWELERRRLCFIWGASYRECWPYAQSFERGRTRTVTSDRGNVVRVTLR